MIMTLRVLLAGELVEGEKTFDVYGKFLGIVLDKVQRES
jgi:hypothetical protein